MQISRRGASLIGIMCSEAGFIWGVALGSAVAIVPVGVFVAVVTQNPYLMFLALAPQCLATMYMAFLAVQSGLQIKHDNRIVEAVGGLLVFFVYGFLMTLIALPYLLFLLVTTKAYQLTGDQSWLRSHEVVIKKIAGEPRQDGKA